MASGLQVQLRSASPIRLEAEFDCAAGELLALVGPSGSGKTSMLRAIAGLWTPADVQGQIRVAGQTWLDTAAGVQLSPQQRRAGLVFQQYALFPHMTAQANVALAAGPGWTQADVQALLSRWPLSDFTVHPLPNPAKVEPRIAISATVRPPGQPAFRFVGTHLDATRDDTARWQQAARLIELFGADAPPTILVGDLSARPETRIIKALLQPFADASAASPAPTIPAEKPTGRIDFVLLRPATTWRVLSSTVIPESVASDHRPLLVELTPTAAK